MARIRLYIATSLDGYIATPDGGVAWLEPFDAGDEGGYGYEEFLKGIGALIMGRATFDQVLGFGDWPYAGKRAIVLSSRPADALPEGVEVRNVGAAAAAEEARGFGGGDIWLMGGGNVVRQFLDAGLIDDMEIFVMPVLLGGGVPLFPESANQAGLVLKGVDPYPNGVVRLLYSVGG